MQSGGEYSTFQRYTFLVRSPRLKPKSVWLLKGKSSPAELLSCYHHWRLTRNSSKAADVIFLDLSKAFDSVPHERLLLKLNRHGVDGPLLLWFRNFLKNGHRVTIRGTFSNWSPVTPGVPQGTILGPTLFLLYVNDMTIQRFTVN